MHNNFFSSSECQTMMNFKWIDIETVRTWTSNVDWNVSFFYTYKWSLNTGVELPTSFLSDGLLVVLAPDVLGGPHVHRHEQLTNYLQGRCHKKCYIVAFPWTCPSIFFVLSFKKKISSTISSIYFCTGLGSRSRVFLAPWNRSRFKKKPGAGAGAAWKKVRSRSR